MPSERNLKLLLAAGAVLFASIAVAVALVSGETLSENPLLGGYPVLASVAAALLAGALVGLRRLRMGREAIDPPKWLLLVSGAKTAALGSILLLLLLLAISWLAGSPAAALFMRATVTIIVAVGLVSIWSLLVLQLQLLIRR